MEIGTFLIAVAAGGVGLTALLGLGWLLERPLGHEVRAWVSRLRDQRRR